MCEGLLGLIVQGQPLVALVAHPPRLLRVGRMRQEQSAGLLAAPPSSTQVTVALLPTTVQLIDMAHTKVHIYQWWPVSPAAVPQP